MSLIFVDVGGILTAEGSAALGTFGFGVAAAAVGRHNSRGTGCTVGDAVVEVEAAELVLASVDFERCRRRCGCRLGISFRGRDDLVDDLLTPLSPAPATVGFRVSAPATFGVGGTFVAVLTLRRRVRRILGPPAAHVDRRLVLDDGKVHVVPVVVVVPVIIISVIVVATRAGGNFLCRNQWGYCGEVIN